MLYGGDPPKPVPPSKTGITLNMGCTGPEPYTYGFVSIV